MDGPRVPHADRHRQANHSSEDDPGAQLMARRGDGIYLRVTRTLLDALLVALGAVTAFWWVVP
jgi:hypothetical protein